MAFGRRSLIRVPIRPSSGADGAVPFVVSAPYIGTRKRKQCQGVKPFGCKWGKSVGNSLFFACADSRRWTLCIMCRPFPSSPLSALKRPELEALLVEQSGEIVELKQTVADLREENARLKGLKGRPNIKPSGMDKGTAPAKPANDIKRPGRGKVTPRVQVEDEVIRVEIPPGSIFKGHEPFLVQDLVISAKATCYLRERWITPDGRTILAPLPEGTTGPFRSGTS